ncbi:recA-like protein [Stakelama sp. CBK3Z-3]|uniref:RecA-like protein n=1 Tax=Stakelama flava TaxID=2860338 RepID=A0ABS6XR59_9SPHN|nr:recA-like protein [Stakelama flava]MBW4332374.1 recA-like protein [Stakelama flava]
MPDADALPLPANDAIPDCVPNCVDALRAADLPAAFAGGGEEWSPERDLPPSLWELFSSMDDASGEALALAFAEARLQGGAHAKHWLWVQDAQSIRRGGRPFLHGLPVERRHRLVHVEARNAADALWAMEEGVRCGALSFVIGELAGDPKSLDFTATRRLVLAAERHGVPLYLSRRDGFANLSAARLRWRVEAAPSGMHRWNTVAPGAPRAGAELFRGRGLRPGRFTLEHSVGHHEPGQNACHRLALVPEPCDRPLEPEHRGAG